ncbi:zf-CCHC type zinc finger protein [Schizosaccharomyces cryophilus OY26]|uniref:Zf-CCHC type zinc finger protein n=1 Tax=Schizosaccharomyces cryophilus (strain OY26 / ATCC MYA-4695 / CBS 11777 / NBRC 106824 / NRRL Y48691) TaxID=653667 RepID=S9XC72_SCHCR|nr:zf-CCHC type zinc finger protein [Schizosaccharomyces cryophilus OY26]EPY51406.1 zf-CCHC type zinc finger protein [Schizosaccharomyces cryophilus OY26]
MARITNMGKRKKFLEATPYQAKPVEAARDDSPNNNGDGSAEDPKNNMNNRADSKSDQRQRKSRSEHRRIRRQNMRMKDKFCFACRKPGHIVQHCPEAKSEVSICFRCGSKEHTLSACPKKGPLQFAVCFICHEKGHLAGQCEKNPHGLYPKGGGCKFCGSVHHYAKDCDQVRKEDVSYGHVLATAGTTGADEDVFHEYAREVNRPSAPKPSSKPAKKTVTF